MILWNAVVVFLCFVFVLHYHFDKFILYQQSPRVMLNHYFSKYVESFRTYGYAVLFNSCVFSSFIIISRLYIYI